jgi:hypothetical protein
MNKIDAAKITAMFEKIEIVPEVRVVPETPEELNFKGVFVSFK